MIIAKSKSFQLQIVILLFLCFVHSHAQELNSYSFATLDSLFQQEKHRNFNKAKRYAETQLEKASANNDDGKKVKAYYNLAVISKKLGEKDATQNAIYNLRALAKATDNNKYVARSYFLEGNLYYEEGKNKEALSFYLNALAISKNATDQQTTLFILYNIATLKKEIQNTKEALVDAKEALEGFKAIEDRYSEVSALHLISEIYLDLHTLDSVKHYIDVGLKTSTLYKDEEAYFLLLSTQGKLLHKQKKYTEALAKFKASEHYFKNNSKIRRQIVIDLYIARVYYELEDYKKVIAVLENAEATLVKENISFTDAPELYYLLAESYSKLDDYEHMKVYYQKFEQLQKTINSENSQLLNKIHKEYDIKNLEQKIAQMQDDSKNKQNTIILTATILIVTLAVFLFSYYRKHQQNEKRLAEILEKLKIKEAAKKAAKEATSNKEEEKEEDKKVKTFENENVARILSSLEALEATDYFLTPNCTLNAVAKEINTNTSYLSKIINEYKEKSFSKYINEYRINTALERLKNDEKYQRYTIEYIAEEFGFSRPETFSRVFKKQTGISPSYYMKKIKSDNL